MKKKIFQRWKRVEYKGEKFKYWSSQIEGEGDKTLSIREKKSQKKKNWRKIIILKPLGNSEAVFSMGYEDIFGNIKISTARRKVEQGPFGMMMGFENCKFFIASNDGWVGLRFVKYVDIDDDVSEYPDFVLF